MSRIRRGTIVGLYRAKESGMGMLGIEDDRRGKVLIPCDGNPTCRAFDAAFGGVIRGGQFHNDGIAGERIYYRVDEQGALAEFVPEETAPPEVVAEYEAANGSMEKGGSTVIGYLPANHPIYTRGPRITTPYRPPKKPPREFN